MTTGARTAGRISVAAGSAVVVGSVGLASAGVEPFPTWLYHFAWYGTLLALWGGLAWRDGRPPLGGAEAISLLFWSASFWYLYELLNLRLANWYYVLVPAERPVRWAGTFVAFATVLPALRLGYAWMERWGLAEGWRRPRFTVRGWQLAALAAGGVAFLALALWRPRAFFPLVWGAVTLLLEPWNWSRDPGSSLFGDLSRGRYARIVRLLAGGLAIGLLWEAFNGTAGARWVYTVPGLERFKLFEMPFPGFLGFPVLALDGYVAYRALGHLGVAAPGWDEGDPGPEVEARPASRDRPGEAEDDVSAAPGEPKPASRDGSAGSEARRGRDALRPVRATLAGILALVFCGAVQAGVDRWTVDSVQAPLETLPTVSAEAAGTLRGAGLDRPAELAAVDSAELARRTGWSPRRAGEAVRAARLAELRGLGAAHARALWTADVRSLCDLAGEAPARVSGVVAAGARRPRAGHPPRVRVWLRAAAEACPAERTD
jgi:hypothetical protein